METTVHVTKKNTGGASTQHLTVSKLLEKLQKLEKEKMTQGRGKSICYV